jgi:hypothetical protein
LRYRYLTNPAPVWFQADDHPSLKLKEKNEY